MRDAYTNWRTAEDGDLEATETSSAIKIGPAPVVGHGVAITVPEQAADADTLDITFTESATESGTYREFAKVRPQVTGAGTLPASARTHSRDFDLRIYNTQPWVKAVFTVGGSSPNFGEVSAGLDPSAYRNDLPVGNNL